MLFMVYPGTELRDFFVEKLQTLLNKKSVEMQAFNFKPLLCGSKRNTGIKLNTNKEIIFSQLYFQNCILKKFFGGNCCTY